MVTIKPALSGPAQATTPQQVLGAAPGVRCVSSKELLAPAGELLIEHGGAYYRLRVTRQGKLILTK
jgi:hemin uptake protein HemP